MPLEGSYTPKFKIGQTITTTDYPNMEFIIFSTYRGLDVFNCSHASCPTEFNESEPAKVMYATWNAERRTYYWVFEPQAELYCSNCNRGKIIMANPEILKLIVTWFNFSVDGLTKFKAILENQPTEDS